MAMSASVEQSKDFPVSWEELHRSAKALAWRLSEYGPWEGIVAITRGGLVPACIVARELHVKVIETLCISSYDIKDQQEKGDVLRKPENLGTGKGWLIIDDLVDTGNTFRLAQKLWPDAHYACVFAKPQGAETADTYVTEVSQDTWIFFPWEDQEAQFRVISGKTRNKK